MAIEPGLMPAGMLMIGRLAPPLFDEAMTHGRFAQLLDAGWRIKSTRLTATFDWPHFIEQYGSNTVLMFGVEEKGTLQVASTKRELEPRPGWLVIALVPPAQGWIGDVGAASWERLQSRCSYSQAASKQQHRD